MDQGLFSYRGFMGRSLHIPNANGDFDRVRPRDYFYSKLLSGLGYEIAKQSIRAGKSSLGAVYNYAYPSSSPNNARMYPSRRLIVRRPRFIIADVKHKSHRSRNLKRVLTKRYKKRPYRRSYYRQVYRKSKNYRNRRYNGRGRVRRKSKSFKSRKFYKK